MSAIMGAMDMPTEQVISEMEANNEGTTRAEAAPKKQTSGRGCNFLVALARKAHRSQRQAAPASRGGSGRRLLKCVPAGMRRSEHNMSAPQMQQIFEALDKLCVTTCVQCGGSVNACRNQSVAVCHSCLLNGGSHADGCSFASNRSHVESTQSNDSASSLSSPARSYISEGLVVTEVFPEREAYEQLQDVLQSSSELPEQVKSKEQLATGVAAPEQTSEEQELSPSMPETGKQFALVATTLHTSERSNWLSPAWLSHASAVDKRVAERDLAEKASDQELPEMSADTEASTLHLAEVGPTREEAHVVNNRNSQTRPGKASLAVAKLLPSALLGLKRAASLAQKAKEHVQKTSGDMIDVELAYVPV
jgi:hypothetical protein